VKSKNLPTLGTTKPK